MGDARSDVVKEKKRKSSVADTFRETGHSMDDRRIHYRSAGNRPAPVVQRIIAEEGKEPGVGVDRLLKIYAEKYPSSTYSVLFETLNASKERISIVYERGVSRYDPRERKLYLNFSLLDQLNKALKDEKGSAGIISDLLSNICHELAHAYDFIGDKEHPPKESLSRDGEMSDETFISTELSAWAWEAISVLEINKQYALKHNEVKSDLIEGWMQVTPDMLDNLSANRKNCIIGRLIQYLQRRLKYPPEMSEIQGWINPSARKDRYKKQIESLKTDVMKKLPIQEK